jgi:hypothetical protein
LALKSALHPPHIRYERFYLHPWRPLHARQDLRSVGHLGNMPGAHKTGSLDTPDPGRNDKFEHPQLLVQFDKLFFRLNTVAGPYLDYMNLRWHIHW